MQDHVAPECVAQDDVARRRRRPHPPSAQFATPAYG
jgi:hypothetical protein